MGSIVDIQVLDEKIILKIPQKNIVHEVNNVAAFDLDSRRLLYFGESPQDLQVLNPKKWEKQKDKMEFVPIFAKGIFSPEAGAMLLWDWWSQVSRYVVPQYHVFKHQANLELNIFYENYETAPQEQREEFEYLIFKFLYAKKLTVNGKEKGWSRRNWLPGSLYLGITYVFLLCFIMLSVIPMSFAITLLEEVNISSWLLNLLLHMMAILGSAVVFIYTGNFIASLIWILILKQFFDQRILLMTLNYPGSQPRKHKIGRIGNLLVNWILPENGLP